MGVLAVDVSYAWERFGGAWWGVLSVGQGSPAHHSGFAVGPVLSPRVGVPAAVFEALIGSASDGEAAFVEALGDVPTVNAGPFPGVVPATWYAGLPALVRAEVFASAVAWGEAGLCP